MDVTPEFVSQLQQQAGQLRASQALGRLGAMSRLFDYLLERSLAGDAAPKEIEIALNVFGKPATAIRAASRSEATASAARHEREFQSS